jgi:hypothetical protein
LTQAPLQRATDAWLQIALNPSLFVLICGCSN